MDNYLWLLMIIYLCGWLLVFIDDYLRLFVILDIFGIKRCLFCDYWWLFVIIDDYLWSFISETGGFLIKIFLLSLVVSVSEWATQNDKTRNSRYYDFRNWYKNYKTKIEGVKNLFSLLKFYKMAFLEPCGICK